MSARCLEHALVYAADGWKVFPCEANAKKPLTPHGFQNASDDVTQIERWWQQHPAANLGIATGAVSGIIALDVDLKNGARGFDSLAELEAEHGPLPETMTSRTPSGGEHRLFAHPGHKIKSRAGVRPGLDARADGGYIIAPPSTIGGRPYEWTREADIATPPAWLIELLTARENNAGVDWGAVHDGIPQGKRNDVIFRLACSLRARGVPFDEARLKILGQAASCNPPLEPQEAEEIVNGVYARYQGGAAFRLTEVGNAERLVLSHGRDLRFCYRLEKWFLFDGTIWRPDEGDGITRLAKTTHRELYAEAVGHTDDALRSATAKWAAASESERRVRATIELSKSEAGIPVRIDALDSDPWLLAVRDGVIDLRTGALREALRDDLITKQCAVTFDTAAQCPEWDKFLGRVLPDEDVRRFVQRALGYSLTGDTREQCLFFLHGSGANGKSTMLNSVQMILGDYARQAGAETWMVKNGGGPSNDVARLRGARFVPTVEVEDGQRLAESLVKQSTGQDVITARFLYAEYFEFKPEFKLWLAANHKPVIRGDDNAIWRRIRLIPFNVSVPPGEQDKTLPGKLLAEASGVLNWLIAGCLDWQRAGLQEPEQVLAATANYRTEMDSVAQFIGDECELGPTFSELASDLYRRYQTWCENGGLRYMSKNRFGRRLTERGIELQEARYARRLGIRLKELGD